MKLTFKGGIHPLHRQEEGKALSASVPIAEMPAPKIVRIPLRQDISKPAIPFVQPGDRVLMGQLLGKADGFLSVPIHSSVAGTVTAIEEIPSADGKTEPAIIIENDFTDETAYHLPRKYEEMSDSDIIHAIKWGGIVGMGGAGFPTHVKLSAPPQKRVDLLIINGAECEPFLTADQRLMTEQPENILLGTRIMMKALNVKRAIVGIEDNKPDAIAAMREALGSSRHIRVEAVETKYPQGYEKTLIYALTGRVVPAGGLPMDAQVVVVNAASASAVADLFLKGEPSIRRVVTVTGGVKNPGNFLIRVGTSMEEAIEAAGGIEGVPLKIISGGPMMGRIVPTTMCAITKNTSGIVILDKRFTGIERETPCIRCAKCGEICPMNLSPMMLADAAEADDWDTANAFHAMDCMSCGSCSYTCPAHRPLAQSIAFAKTKLHAKRIQEAKEKEEREKAEKETAEAAAPVEDKMDVQLVHDGQDVKVEITTEGADESEAAAHAREDAEIAETLNTQTTDADPAIVQDIEAAADEFEEESREEQQKADAEQSGTAAETVVISVQDALPAEEEVSAEEIAEDRFGVIDGEIDAEHPAKEAALAEATEELIRSNAAVEDEVAPEAVQKAEKDMAAEVAKAQEDAQPDKKSGHDDDGGDKTASRKAAKSGSGEKQKRKHGGQKKGNKKGRTGGDGK